VKDLEGLAARPEVQPPVGEHAIDIKDQEANGVRHGRAVRRASHDAGTHQIMDIERAQQPPLRVGDR